MRMATEAGTEKKKERVLAVVGPTAGGKSALALELARTLGGEMQSVPKSADVCSRIPILPFFPVIFQFWEGDEEFAPKIMILWDKKALDFMHFETLYYVIGLLLQRLAELCDKN